MYSYYKNVFPYFNWDQYYSTVLFHLLEIFSRLLFPCCSADIVHTFFVQSLHVSTQDDLHDKNCPAFAGIPVELVGIPLCRDGTKNVRPIFFPYTKRSLINMRATCGKIKFNVPPLASRFVRLLLRLKI